MTCEVGRPLSKVWRDMTCEVAPSQQGVERHEPLSWAVYYGID